MQSIDTILDMIAMDALMGGPREHFFDEARDPHYNRPPPEPRNYDATLPPIARRLSIVRNPDGSYAWKEV